MRTFGEGPGCPIQRRVGAGGVDVDRRRQRAVALRSVAAYGGGDSGGVVGLVW